jgi:hypothetical protein
VTPSHLKRLVVAHVDFGDDDGNQHTENMKTQANSRPTTDLEFVTFMWLTRDQSRTKNEVPNPRTREAQDDARADTQTAQIRLLLHADTDASPGLNRTPEAMYKRQQQYHSQPDQLGAQSRNYAWAPPAHGPPAFMPPPAASSLPPAPQPLNEDYTMQLLRAGGQTTSFPQTQYRNHFQSAINGDQSSAIMQAYTSGERARTKWSATPIRAAGPTATRESRHTHGVEQSLEPLSFFEALNPTFVESTMNQHLSSNAPNAALWPESVYSPQAMQHVRHVQQQVAQHARPAHPLSTSQASVHLQLAMTKPAEDAGGKGGAGTVAGRAGASVFAEPAVSGTNAGGQLERIVELGDRLSFVDGVATRGVCVMMPERKRGREGGREGERLSVCVCV